LHCRYYPETFNATEYIEDCQASHGVTPNLHAMVMKFGGRRGMQQTSNVIFTNGAMDPWAAQSVLEDVSESVV
jgi:hypothetical protein